MINDEIFIDSLRKHYPDHTFRISHHGRGRTLYVNETPVKLSWIVNSDLLEELLDDENKMNIDQEIVDAIMVHVNNAVTKTLEEKANREIPDLHKCLCGEQPKLQIEFLNGKHTVSVQCLCGLKGKAFEVKDAIEAATWWNTLHGFPESRRNNQTVR